jgi:hypothetical protein
LNHLGEVLALSWNITQFVRRSISLDSAWTNASALAFVPLTWIVKLGLRKPHCWPTASGSPSSVGTPRS